MPVPNPNNRGGPGGKREGAGRPFGAQSKVRAELAEAAREYTDAALGTLVNIMKDDKAPHASRVAAATAVLDRGHGKPRQMMELSGKDGGPIETTDVGIARNIVRSRIAGIAGRIVTTGNSEQPDGSAIH